MGSNDEQSGPAAAEVTGDVRDTVGYLTLNRPARRNAMTAAMQHQILAQLRAWDQDAAVRVIVVRGAGGNFCAGADLGRFEDQASAVHRYFEREVTVEMYDEFTRLSKPVIAAVEGYCLAGGLGLAESCDVVLAAADAKFGLPEIKFGIWPMMVMPIVFRNIGRKKGMDLMLTGRSIDAGEAERAGLVSQVVPNDSFANDVHEYAKVLASHSAIIHRLGREAFYAMCDLDVRKALQFMRSQLAILTTTEDSKEGPRAFREKRPPRYQDK